jgi:enoyl-CoA hydratase/carnithine racemase
VISPKGFKYELSPLGVAQITLSRPERLNALTFEIYQELREVMLALDHEEAIRAVILPVRGVRSRRAGMSRTSSANSSSAI